MYSIDKVDHKGKALCPGKFQGEACEECPNYLRCQSDWQENLNNWQIENDLKKHGKGRWTDIPSEDNYDEDSSDDQY
ncbi:MAG: hypothetical protein LBL60_03585 [Mycoplasmataceae bacterium]|jgi:hypothetical protein|nr:hypothetical protein [Mycoplasmataceae bacterium]